MKLAGAAILVLLAAPAMAQPIILPLQSQRPPEPPPPPPSPVPVAPPQAGPAPAGRTAGTDGTAAPAEAKPPAR